MKIGMADIYEYTRGGITIATVSGLPGFDAWLTTDPRDAEEPDAEQEQMCLECEHTVEECDHLGECPQSYNAGPVGPEETV